MNRESSHKNYFNIKLDSKLQRISGTGIRTINVPSVVIFVQNLFTSMGYKKIETFEIMNQILKYVSQNFLMRSTSQISIRCCHPQIL